MGDYRIFETEQFQADLHHIARSGSGGPPFAATLRQDSIGDGRTRVTYKFNLEARPRWLSPLLTPVCNWVFRQEVRERLKALKTFLESPPGLSTR